jgi:hypothetical protein
MIRVSSLLKIAASGIMTALSASILGAQKPLQFNVEMERLTHPFRPLSRRGGGSFISSQ